ncbi:MAG: AAA family ATPase [Coriobacteriaceae bacterium]|nr:AAA family ATPase [Coriobacteriaceae bacterium]
MAWKRFIVKGVWKNGTGCFGKVYPNGEEVALSCAPVALSKGMVVQGQFSEDPKGFAGKRLFVLERHVPGMSEAQTADVLRSVGLSLDELHAIYGKFGRSAAYALLSRPSNMKKLALDLGSARVAEIQEKLNALRHPNDVRQAFPFLSKALCEKLSGCLGHNAVALLTSDPYAWCSGDGALVRFADAERIYMHTGGNPMSEKRIDSLLLRSMESILGRTGDMFLEVSDDEAFWGWMTEASELSGRVDGSWELPAATLANLAMDFVSRGGACLERDGSASCLYSMSNLADERAVAALGDMASLPPLYKGDGRTTLRRIEDYCERAGLVSVDGDVGMDDLQIMAVANALRHRVSVIAGGPGRGKTAITSCICDCWQAEFGAGSNIMLTSLTGKAVSRLKSSVGRTVDMDGVRACTMASVIVNPKIQSGGVNRTLVVVDEASMVDMHSMARFLGKMGDVQMVFIGDVDQLPSIGAGQLLRDLIDSDVFEVTYLEKNYRARGRDGATLADNADAIAENRIADVRYDEYFNWHDASAGEAEVFADILSKYMDLMATEDAADVCLLSPFKSEKDPFSVVRLNHAIHRAKGMAPGAPGAYAMYYGEPILPGDRVVVTHNLPDYAVVNGDTGELVRYMSDGEALVHLDDDRELLLSRSEAADNLEMGYALTVHKSQGSEYRHVLFAVSGRMAAPWARGFATRNLVYTAVTRSSSRVHLFGSRPAFERSLANTLPPRRTRLVERLRGDL